MSYVGTVILWNGVTSSAAVPQMYVQQVNRNMFGDVLDEEVQLPGRDGAWVFPDSRGNRSIGVRCQIVDVIPSRRGDVESAASWLNVSGYADLLFSDQSDRYWRAYLKTAPPVDEWRKQGKFGLEWRAEPYAYAVALSSQCVTADGGSESGSFTIPDALGAAPVIEITPLNGTITYYTLGVEATSLAVSATIESGHTQTVSSYSYTITGGQNAEAELNGAYDASPTWTVDASGEFPLLVPGLNDWSFAWSGTATSVRICFYWRRRYH